MGQQKNYANAGSGGAAQNYAAQAAPHNFASIIGGDNVDELVTAAEQIGIEIAKRVTSNQIRGIFATVRQIQLSWPEKATAAESQKAYRRAMMLKPQIRYAAARNNDRIRPLDEYLVSALNEVKGTAEEQRQRFMRFVDFFEAIIAYHKYEGGR